MKFFVLAISMFFAVSAVAQKPELPREWVEKETGKRVVRLSDDDGSSSFYFHQNGYTAKGDKMVFSTRDGLSVIEFKTRKITSIVKGRASSVIVGRNSRKVFYIQNDTVMETDLDSGANRTIVKDARLRTGSGLAVNADETLLGGSMTTGDVPPEARSDQGRGDAYPGKGEWMERRLAARVPMSLYTVNIKSGEVKLFHAATDWLNHVQFSPTDPTLMMFCHEGPWHKVDRIWTIRTDGSGLKKIHTRTMDMEIAGHEFFSPDGKFIIYDLQTPKSQVFWLAKYEIKSEKLTKYSLARREWSVHYNMSPDGKLFSGDGGGPNSVAKGDNGQWIYLFRPKNGRLVAERLVDLAKHDYTLEPNATFTPDGKWLVFRSNILGPTHVFAVEIKR